jgi:hypothetical protein
MKIKTGKYSDGKYVPGISGYVILKSIGSCQEKNFPHSKNYSNNESCLLHSYQISP